MCNSTQEILKFGKICLEFSHLSQQSVCAESFYVILRTSSCAAESFNVETQSFSSWERKVQSSSLKQQML